MEKKDGVDKIGLTGFKIDIREYRVENRLGQPGDGMTTVSVQENLATICFHPDLKLKPEEMFKAKDIADAVRDEKSGFIILDKEQMAHVRRCYDCLIGLPETMIEFLSRIRDAESIILTEAQNKE